MSNFEWKKIKFDPDHFGIDCNVCGLGETIRAYAKAGCDLDLVALGFGAYQITLCLKHYSEAVDYFTEHAQEVEP